MKEDNWNWKAADAITYANVILTVKRAPNANCRTAGDKNAKCNPPTSADMLTPQPSEQGNDCPATKCEKNDDEQDAHTHSVAYQSLDGLFRRPFIFIFLTLRMAKRFVQRKLDEETVDFLKY